LKLITFYYFHNQRPTGILIALRRAPTKDLQAICKDGLTGEPETQVSIGYRLSMLLEKFGMEKEVMGGKLSW
jgi:hypothetical protein